MAAKCTPQLIGPGQLAQQLGISKPTLRRWERQGVVPAGKRINRRCVRWNTQDVNAWLQTWGGRKDV